MMHTTGMDAFIIQPRPPARAR
eukprot:SAG31_NODE_39333_length_289_cov_0.794737_1_plen_21_part_10